MDLLIAALLGVLQGLTEFLPISSTAHLLIVADLLGYEDPGGVFTVMIQLGSILAVMWLYREKIAAVALGLPSDPQARHFATAVLVGFLPALAAGALLANYVKTVLYESPRVIALAFVIGGIVMLLVERFRPAPTVCEADRTPVRRAFGVGVFQTVALIPGVSRSGATIVGGMLMRLDRAAAAEFSFFLAMPTMIAAFVHDLLDLVGARGQVAPGRAAEIAVGFLAAFVAAAIVVGPFLRFVGRAGFAPFAWYRIAAGVALLGAIGMGLL
ncbi:MAG TPA: undecaprenyl-diphosphate phosphatase [Vicinamibacterales bacterium]|nr:undecaprenyl-diphosphate phosphatase [Vicinamibacterales bacterium]